MKASDHQGVADLTANLMKEGTEKLTSSQLADEAARMGSTLNVSSSYDRTNAELDVLSEFGPDAVRLLADVVAHPRLPESELERLKNDKLRQIALGTSQPQTIALMRFRKILYGDHPYSVILPSEADVKKITIQDVKEYVSSNFNPRRTHIYVAGRFDVPAVKKAVADSLGGWNKTGPARAENVPKPNPQRVLDVTDRPGAPQSTIIIGLPVAPANSPDAIPLQVTNALLGGSFNSRITANIREQKGYTYSPFGQISSRYRDSYWAENADVTTKFTGASLKEIVAEINRLASRAANRRRVEGHPELPFRPLHSAQLEPRRPHRAVAKRRCPGPGRGLSEDLRRQGECRLSRRRAEDDRAIPQAAVNDHRGGGRQIQDYRSTYPV